MTRGAKTLVFLFAATAANILVTGLVFILLLAVYGLSLGRVLALRSSAPVILGAFLAAVIISAFAYKKSLDWARKRWNLEEKLGFGPRKKGGSGDTEVRP